MSLRKDFLFQSLSLLLLGQPGLNQEPSKPSENPPAIRVEVGLVSLTATVFDHSGRPIPDLERNDFEISEDGVPQDIAVFQREDVPVSVGILFDTSGSMVDKIEEVRDAVIHFIHTTNPADDIFLMRFSAEVYLVQDFTSYCASSDLTGTRNYPN